MQTGQSLNRLCVAKLRASPTSFPMPGAGEIQTGPICVDLLNRIVRQWQGDLVGLLLFGSAARGEATEGSDIDLLLVLRPEVRIERGLYRIWEEFCRESHGNQDLARISPHFVRLPSSVESAGGLWYEAAIDGIALWERGLQVSRFLGAVRKAMGQGEIRRMMLHGSPYWVKKVKESDAQ